MNWLKKYRIIHFFNPAFIFILLSGSGLYAQTSQGYRSNDTIWVKETIASEQLVAADTFYVSQPDPFTEEEGYSLSAGSKEEMKARRKAKANRFWNNFLLGFFRILITDGCCDCDDY